MAMKSKWKKEGGRQGEADGIIMNQASDMCENSIDYCRQQRLPTAFGR